jgi:GTP-binding protein
LEQYNPELLTKARILAISKTDIQPAESNLQQIDYAQLSEEIGIPVLPISAVAGTGIEALKDALWTELNKEQNQIIEISHAPIDITAIERSEPTIREENEDEQQTIYLNEVEEDWDLDKYKGIGWDE